MAPHVFLVAVEDSGDALGADVIRELRALEPDVRISGVGASAMAAEGASADVDLSGLSVVGLFDGVKALKRAKECVSEVADLIQKADPDAVVLVDSWGFMWRLARELKLRGARAKRIKLIGPQVWATRPGRAKVLAEWCDHLLCIHDFETPYYKRAGLPTTVIGNPALGRLKLGDAHRFRLKYDIPDTTDVIGLLLGSRKAELRRVGPALVESARRLTAGRSDRLVVGLAAPSVRQQILEMAQSWDFPHVIVTDNSDKSDAMAAMKISLACSGTVTTELAAQGSAVLVGYKLGWVSWALARLFLLKSPYITLVNVAAGKELAPEFIQTRLRPDLIVEAAGQRLSDAAVLAAQVEGQAAAIAKMRGQKNIPAARVAAGTILDLSGSGLQP